MTDSTGPIASITNAPEASAPIEGVEGEAPSTETVEAKPEAKEAPKEADPKIASRFAALSKKEKSIREAEHALKVHQHKIQIFDESQALAKSDPLALLEKIGVTFDDLANHVLDKEFGPKHETEAQKLAKIEERLSSYEQQREKERVSAEQATINRQITNFKGQIDSHLKANPDNYELISLNGAEHEVYNVIEANFLETKQMLTIEEAAKMVEEYFYQQAKRLTQAKKLSIVTPQDPPKVQAKTPDVKDKVTSKTLTTKATSATHVGNKEPISSRTDAIKQAALKIKWT